MSLTREKLQALLGSRYRLERELGGGSMATVYLAEDARHGRQVAIKVLRQEYAATFAAERFLREIDIAARLQHPHIVPLLDSGEVAGNLYLVMPFIEGESLRVRLVRAGPLPVGDVIRIMADVADALAYAHGKGIIHRDIKPDNILLAGRHALVTDFGVAKAIAASNPPEPASGMRDPSPLTIGVALGTPAYMAPEQATADPGLDHRVDLYALGVVAYELLTGAPPFDGPTPQAILTAHVLDQPAPLIERRSDVPGPFAAIVERCLAKQPADRWQSADDLLQHLEPLATPSGGTTPAAVAPVLSAPKRSSWKVAAILIITALAGAGAMLLRPETQPTSIGQRQLTFSGRVASAAISPDGQQLAFISDSAGIDRLQVQDLRGGRAILLATGKRLSYPTWSGDGSQVRCILFDSTYAQLMVVPRLGGAARISRVATFSVLSPDGERLLELQQGGTRVVIRSFTGGDSSVAPIEPDWWHSPGAWSKDGSLVAWSEVKQSGGVSRLFAMSVRDLKPIMVLEDSVPLGSPAFDGSGDGIYLLRGAGRITDLIRIPLKRDGSPGGVSRIVMQGLSVGLPDMYISFSGAVSVSGDGTRVLYTQRQDWSNLGMVDFESWQRGGMPRLLTTGSADYLAARLSPDGKELAVVRGESDGLSLQILPLAGGPTREVARIADGEGLAWSPDGKQLLVSLIDPDSGLGLGVFPIDGRGRTYGFGTVGSSAAWLNDSVIVTSRLGNRSLLLFEPGSGRRYPLPGADTIGWMLYPQASPDGKKVLFAWNQGHGKQGAELVNLADSTSRPVAMGLVNPLGWTGDGKGVFIVGSQFLADSDRVTLVPVTGGPPRVLGAFPPSMEVVDVTRDGKSAIVNVHERRSDAWLLLLPPQR